jgi:CRP-like cAMP-binding protein
MTFLDSLGSADRGAFLSLGSARSYAHGEAVFVEGDRGEFVVAITDGWASVSSCSRFGQRVVLALRGSGDLVGDLSVLDRNPRSATVTSLGPMEAVVVPGESFRAFLGARPRVTELLFSHLGSRLRAADDERMSLATETVIQRLAAYLGELTEHAGVPTGGGVAIELQLPQHELAAAVGATREAVAKALRVLREKALVETGPGSLIVLDGRSLREISTGRTSSAA